MEDLLPCQSGFGHDGLGSNPLGALGAVDPLVLDEGDLLAEAMATYTALEGTVTRVDPVVCHQLRLVHEALLAAAALVGLLTCVDPLVHDEL